MDFSEIGVRSRKTGLKAKENVRRDKNNMEDIDEFFKDEQTTLTNQPNALGFQSQQPSSSQFNNGRIIFPTSSRPSSQAQPFRKSPLRSPLRSRPSRARGEEDDIFTDAYEQPMVIDTQENDDDMEIDDESKGVIKQVNGPADEDDNASIVATAKSVNPPTISQQRAGEKLFASSDEDDTRVNKSLYQRQLELERNTTVRTTSNRSIKHGSATPKASKRHGSDHEEILVSPLKSMLNSPLQPSSRSMAALAKSIVLNKTTRSRSNLRRDSSDISEPSSVSDSFGDGDYKQTKDNESSDDDGNIQGSNDGLSDSEVVEEISEVSSSPALELPSGGSTSDSDDPESANDSESEVVMKSRGRPSRKAPQSSMLPPKMSHNGRNNKFQRSSISSPDLGRHHININDLRREQSRSESQSNSLRPEQPTRRSSRVRIAPLAFWRNERYVYEKNRDQALPTVKEIITVDEPSPAPTRKPSRMPSRAGSKPRAKSKPRFQKVIENDQGEDNKNQQRRKKQKLAKQSTIHDEDAALPQLLEQDRDQDDEEERRAQNGEIRGSEWMKNGFIKIDAFEGHGSDVKTNRLVAWAPGTENFSQSIVTDQDNFKLAILFDKNREFIAAGMMLIPPHGVKSLKSTDTTYFVFYCISGVVEVTLSGNVFLIKKGCSLEVPMGNFYQFVNKGKKDAALFFVQTRGHDGDDNNWDEEDSG